MSYIYRTVNDHSAGTGAGQGTNPTGNNDRGQIVGYYVDSNGVAHGFLDSGGSYITLNDPAAGTASDQGTFTFSINNLGQIAEEYVDSGQSRSRLPLP